MKKIGISVVLSVFLIGNSQELLATDVFSVNDFDVSNSTNRAALRYHFKSIPPLKYKGKTRINYYSYNGGYIGIYL